MDLEIVLRPRTKENVIIYFHQVQDDEIRQFLPQKAKSVEEAIADYERTLLPGSSSYGRSVYVNSAYIGDIWAYGIGSDDPNAMLSFCLFRKSLWGNGIATRAAMMFLSEIREKFGLRSLGAFTYSDNIASIRVLLHNGFQERETFVEDGRESKYFQLDF